MTAWGILVALQVLSAMWYALPTRKTARPSEVGAEQQA
jgi:hypothetical protein